MSLLPAEEVSEEETEDDREENNSRNEKRNESLDKTLASPNRLKTPMSKKLSTSLVDLSLSADRNNDDTSSSGGSKNQWNSGAFRSAAHQLKKFLSPNVKSRDTEFKRLFEVPETECYITSYSCAFQKEILIHGKLYLSQNYIGFYSNIFGWETKVMIPFKNLQTIKKKRTAKFIPNAVQLITNDNEKLFFTSFASRDKAFVTIFKLWQYSLQNKVATKAEVWAWSHYGTDEAFDDIFNDTTDIICNGVTEEDGYTKNVPVVCIHRASIPDVLERCSTASYGSEIDNSPQRKKKKLWRRNKKGALNKKKSRSLLDIPDADSVSVTSTGSDSSDDLDKEIACGCAVHEGNEIMNSAYPVSVDQMFLLLFTDCPFYRELQNNRKTSDLVLNDWCVDVSKGTKSRQISYTVRVNNPSLAGNKSAAVTENQICETCSNSGKKCVVKCVCQSSGVNYADTFHTFTRYCITRINANQCRLKVYGGINYNKSCWGVVKSIIEKHAMSAMIEYFKDLESHLKQECKRYGLPVKDINSNDVQRELVENEISVESTDLKQVIKNNIELILKVVIVILTVMFITNLVLYYKLITLEKSMDTLRSGSNQRSPSHTLSHWEDAFESEYLHFKEQRSKWTRRLDVTVAIVQQIEDSLKEFRHHLLSVRADMHNVKD